MRVPAIGVALFGLQGSEYAHNTGRFLPLGGVALAITQWRWQEDTAATCPKLGSCQLRRGGVRSTHNRLTMPVESRPIRDAAIHIRLLQQYLLLLKKYPILTKSVTRFVAFLSLLSWHNCFPVVLLIFFLFLFFFNGHNSNRVLFPPPALILSGYCFLTLIIDPNLFCGVNNGVSQSASAEKNSPCKFVHLLWLYIRDISWTLCRCHW